MSYKCEICGKKSTTGKSVSHSHLKTNRTFKPNLHKQKIVLVVSNFAAFMAKLPVA